MTYVLPHLMSRHSKSLQKHSGAQQPNNYTLDLCSALFFRKVSLAAVKRYTLWKLNEKNYVCSRNLCQLTVILRLCTEQDGTIKMYGANKEKWEKSTENCFRDVQTSFSKIVMVNSYLIVIGFCTASLNALRIPSFKWTRYFWVVLLFRFSS